ncbi:tyrosine-type recombinase/integrase [Enterobacter hormaechei]|uniref:tyrosine-type recombinase/integrase n=1 Tax=Enterobacter hormaechei TaxID=158836 RepID=UPI00311AAE30
MGYKTFGLRMKKTNPNLPDGKVDHILRHTFATYFMMNGGSIMALKRIMGHVYISQTIVYALFAPEHQTIYWTL